MILPNIIQKFPQLKVVLEHITTQESVEFVKTASMNLALLYLSICGITETIY